jgi:hypothetical protein
MGQAVEGDNEVVKLDNSSVSEVDPKDQTRLPVLVHLLLALAGIGILKQRSFRLRFQFKRVGGLGLFS